MKWISTPSISVVNCGSALSLASIRAEVVVARPVARELLERRQLDALRPVVDELLGGPVASLRCAAASRRSAPPESRAWKGRISVAVWTVVLMATSVGWSRVFG